VSSPCLNFYSCDWKVVVICDLAIQCRSSLLSTSQRATQRPDENQCCRKHMFTPCFQINSNSVDVRFARRHVTVTKETKSTSDGRFRDRIRCGFSDRPRLAELSATVW
jgi:hypothetical protein